MIIAVASGKGGTGKTTLSVALSLSVDEPVNLLDCDVEEPNADIFLNLHNIYEETVTVPIPAVDNDKCTFCGKCQEICQFNAITVLKNKVLIFDELCHSCGGCERICPEQAISEIKKPIGTVMQAPTNSLSFVQGRLDIGRAMSPPLIRAVKGRMDNSILNIIDCPPGNSCPVITAVNGVDYIILVTEASPFGLHDLKLAVDAVKDLSIPFGVVINRTTPNYTEINNFCEKQSINILLEIPENLKVAKAYSGGHTLLYAMPELKPLIKLIVSDIREELI